MTPAQRQAVTDTGFDPDVEIQPKSNSTTLQVNGAETHPSAPHAEHNGELIAAKDEVLHAAPELHFEHTS